jgi:multidrug efflux pump subunit AcrB
MDNLVSRWRLTVGLSLLVSGMGLWAWSNMPREEDPRLRERFALIVAQYPGASPERIEAQVVEPIEEELAEVEQVFDVFAEIKPQVAIFRVRLRDDVSDVQTAWDEVDDALAQARLEMPAEVPDLFVDNELMATESVVLAISGSNDAVELARHAEALRQRLLSIPRMSSVATSGDPGEQITIAVDDVAARKVGLSPASISQILAARNSSLPGGAIRVAGRTVIVEPGAELMSLEDLERAPLPLPGGGAVELGALATVRVTEAEPTPERARHDGAPVVVLGTIPQLGIDAIAFGEEVRTVVAQFQRERPSLKIDEVAFQPAKVAARLDDLSLSLLQSIGVVAGFLFLTMGLRLGAVVASVVPLVTYASVAIYFGIGGILHQMAVAALVIAMGLLVDNAIVMAEAIQRLLDLGRTRREAMMEAVRELALPLGSATGTTVAAFLPMLLAEGNTGDFTRAIPLVVIITLTASYFYAVFVTPVFAGALLRQSKGAAKVSLLDRVAGGLAKVSARRPLLALLAVALLLAGSASFVRKVRFDFFPTSDREQLVVELRMPEGTDLTETDEASRALEAALMRHPDVRHTTAFVGRSTPQFYYNLPREPRASNLAQLVVTTDSAEAVRRLAPWVREHAARALPKAEVIPRRLEQGPPVKAPVELRLYSPDPDDLRAAADAVRRALRGIDGALDVRDNQGAGLVSYRFAAHDAALARTGTARASVAAALLSNTLGLPVGDFRAGDEPVPIRIRTPEGQDKSLQELAAVDVAGRAPWPTPLDELAVGALDWGRSVIHRRNGQRFVAVMAEVDPKSTHEAVVRAFKPKLEALELPPSVRWELGGAAESSAEANRSLGAKGAIGGLVLIAFVLAEFNSFRRTLIVLATAPLAFLGIWPGLALGNLPFGFVALLGAIALIGIAVNGAIVLIDRADREREAGATLVDAVERATALRTRPILLTAGTTIIGLIPLLTSNSTLWPPLAAAMISGLSVATLLTLVVVPALYRLSFREGKPSSPSTSSSPQPAAEPALGDVA